MHEVENIWLAGDKYTGSCKPQRRADHHGGDTYEEWEYHAVYSGALHIRNYSWNMYRTGWSCLGEKSAEAIRCMNMSLWHGNVSEAFSIFLK